MERVEKSLNSKKRRVNIKEGYIPLTSQEKKDSCYFESEFKKDKKNYTMFNQIKIFSFNRIIKYMGKI